VVKELLALVGIRCRSGRLYISEYKVEWREDEIEEVA
jgi:hypothetical protein